jgi:hypothetical protein
MGCDYYLYTQLIGNALTADGISIKIDLMYKKENRYRFIISDSDDEDNTPTIVPEDKVLYENGSCLSNTTRYYEFCVSQIPEIHTIVSLRKHFYTLPRL